MRRLFEQMMEEIIKEVTSGEKKETTPTDIPRETDGFKSLVTEEEYEAVLKLKEAMDNFIDVHNKCVVNNVSTIVNSSAYSKVQYHFFNDEVENAMSAISKMVTIHTCDKEAIDTAIKETNCVKTVEELEHHIMFSSLLDKIFG